jgi:hypothetical protein
MSDMPGLLRAFLALDKRRKAGGLSPADMARWSDLKSALNRHFEPDAKERHVKSRESVRVPLDLNVNFESRGEIRECLMKNLSAGGIFVATESPLPIGTPFELPGEVVSVGVNASMSREQHGMGIRFAHLTEEQARLVAEFSEEAMKKAIESPSEES